MVILPSGDGLQGALRAAAVVAAFALAGGVQAADPKITDIKACAFLERQPAPPVVFQFAPSRRRRSRQFDLGAALSASSAMSERQSWIWGSISDVEMKSASI